ncbi:MAG: ATP-binding protein [Gammaproteobacteria bacterium]|nr:ATP-binding protein [Gammaproteobacteria bacterium]MYF53270.1 ATP-binding protein [Gammaproteobacteria bacterium]MYK44135.1 ATP-binding protein [Gammaproteobacteria bacterium]
MESVLDRAAREFPAVVLTGPRQSGKTTLLKQVFGKTHTYQSLEIPDIRTFATADPRGFLDSYPSPIILDEIQYVPELLPYIKEKIDAERTRTGQYLLSGSQNLLLSANVTESLAGRAAILRLLPLSHRETEGYPQLPLVWENVASDTTRTHSSPTNLWENFLRGGYPELVSQPERDIQLWHSSYVQTYLERDVRMLRNVGDLSQFQNFLHMLAARSSQLLNLTSLARDLGLAVNTIKVWLSVLEASYQIVILRPYYANIGKRLVKTPKIYFTDVGTLCYLVGLRDFRHARDGPLSGAIFETAVLAEIMRTITHSGEVPEVFFWRTVAGTEIDFVVRSRSGLVPIEVKASATPRRTMATGIENFQRDFGNLAKQGFVIHLGNECLPLSKTVAAVPFTHI